MFSFKDLLSELFSFSSLEVGDQQSREECLWCAWAHIPDFSGKYSLIRCQINYDGNYRRIQEISTSNHIHHETKEFSHASDARLAIKWGETLRWQQKAINCAKSRGAVRLEAYAVRHKIFEAREGSDDSIYFQRLPVNVAAMLISERNSLIAALILPLEKLCSNSHFSFERNEKNERNIREMI